MKLNKTFSQSYRKMTGYVQYPKWIIIGLVSMLLGNPRIFRQNLPIPLFSISKLTLKLQLLFIVPIFHVISKNVSVGFLGNQEVVKRSLLSILVPVLLSLTPLRKIYLTFKIFALEHHKHFQMRSSFCFISEFYTHNTFKILF